MSWVNSFLAGVQTNPVSNLEFQAAYQAESSVFALYSAAGDTITPGTATGSQILADLATYISDEETLLGTLENLAATVPGASAWATPEISWLQYTITAELQLLYNNGGTISGQTEASAVSAVQGSSTSPAIYPVVPGSSTSPAVDTVVGSASAGDQAMESLALQEAAAGNSAAAAATLSLLATSSNPVVASIASAELWLDLHGLWTQDGAGISAAASYIDGNYLANMGLFVAELSSATGATVSFNPVTGISYSSTTAAGSISASDIATESLALQEAAAGSFTAAAATLSILAMSSNAVVASIASAEIYLDTHADWTKDWAGISAAASYIYGNSAAAMSTFVAELSSATGLTVSFSPVTGISYSSATSVGSVAASDIATENLVMQEAAAGSWAAVASNLAILETSSNPAVAGIASADLALAESGQWNATFSSIASGLTSFDKLAAVYLGTTSWNATTSALIMATLSSIVAEDGTNTILGADANAALQMISAGLNPTPDLQGILLDASISSMTSGTKMIGSVTAQERAEIANFTNEVVQTNSNAALATLSILAADSNPIIASIASAEIEVILTKGFIGPLDYTDYILDRYVITGGATPTTDAMMSAFLAELSSATGSPMMWTGSTFVVSSATSVGSVAASDIATENLVMQEAAAGSWAAVASNLAILETSSNPAVAGIASADLALAESGQWNATFSSIASGLTSFDKLAAVYLGTTSWNATTSALIMATLSSIVAEDGTNTILGADANAALQLISEGLDPQAFISDIRADASISSLTSTTSALNGISAQDRAKVELANHEQSVPSALKATLSSLAESNDVVIASIASAELTILNAGFSNISGGLVILWYEGRDGKGAYGVDGDTTAMPILISELSSAVGSPMIWTGTNFVVSSAAPAAVDATQIPITDAAAVALLSTTSWGNAAASALAMATLSVMVARDGSNTVGGADAEAAIEALAAGVPGSQAVAELVTDYNANLSSSETVSGISAQDRSNENLVYEEGQIGNWSAMVAPLQALEGSSNLVVASIASAELAILHKGDWSSDADGISEAASYISGSTSVDLSTFIGETASMMGITNDSEKTKTWTSKNTRLVTVTITGRTATIANNGIDSTERLPDGCNISAKTLARRMAEGYSFQEACMMDLDSGSV